MIIMLVPRQCILPDTATADKGKLTVEKTAKTVSLFVKMKSLAAIERLFMLISCPLAYLTVSTGWICFGEKTSSCCKCMYYPEY
jgi:hypothetical protein